MAKQMRAVYYEQFGGADVIKIGQLDLPEVKEGEVMVKIKAAAINPVDATVRKGHLKAFLPYQFPIIPGWDVAGIIEERGFSARRFNVGDEVYAYARRPKVHLGTFAEYIVLPESYLALRPKNLSLEEVSGIPLVGLTAYQCLLVAGNLQKGQTVLILGASGGVGSIGLQLAKAKGAQVIGVASEKNHEYMKSLGADETINYKGVNVGEAVKKIVPEGVDLIFDCASGESLHQSLSALKTTGKLVSILNRGEGLDKNINFQYVFVEPNATQLAHLCQLAEEGKLHVHISQQFNLENAAEAFKQIETHHTTGKIIIVP
jgi:NADPH:quinone reductase-like Zn-dependent oxidoreductase